MSKKLLQSIKRGDAEGIHDSVRDGADINGTDKKGKVCVCPIQTSFQHN